MKKAFLLAALFSSAVMAQEAPRFSVSASYGTHHAKADGGNATLTGGGSLLNFSAQ